MTFHHLNRAIAIAAEAHAGQNDKAGKPYILHPLRLMAAMTYEDARIVAVLHDVVEDGDGWTLDRLREEGFSDHEVQAIDALTRRRGEEYADYITRLSGNALAVEVKRADLRDNMDLNRLVPRTDEEWDRYAKYARALAYLT